MMRSATRLRRDAFRRGFVDGRQLLGMAGNYQEVRSSVPGHIRAAQGLFLLVVAGVGFEPS